MDSREVVIESANNAAGYVGTEQFVKLVKLAITMVGAEIARHVRPDERPGMLVPVGFEENGKLVTGALLALEERAIVGWTTGTLRIRNFEAVVPYDSVERCEVEVHDGRDVLEMTTQERVWSFVVYMEPDAPKLAPLVQGVMEGWARFEYEDVEPGETEQKEHNVTDEPQSEKNDN